METRACFLYFCSSVCRQSIWGPPEALFPYWRQRKCLLGPKCQPPVHKNHIISVLNGLAAKSVRLGQGWHHFWARLVFVRPASPNPSTTGYSLYTEMPCNVFGQYHRVLTVHKNALKRVWPVPRRLLDLVQLQAGQARMSNLQNGKRKWSAFSWKTRAPR